MPPPFEPCLAPSSTQPSVTDPRDTAHPNARPSTAPVMGSPNPSPSQPPRAAPKALPATSSRPGSSPQSRPNAVAHRPSGQKAKRVTALERRVVLEVKAGQQKSLRNCWFCSSLCVCERSPSTQCSCHVCPERHPSQFFVCAGHPFRNLQLCCFHAPQVREPQNRAPKGPRRSRFYTAPCLSLHAPHHAA
jgi:hypothetical protein